MQAATERAWTCGLHNVNALDLRFSLSWSPAGCVESVMFHTPISGAIGDCIDHRFKRASIKPFSGRAPTLFVHFRNDRASYEWQEVP